MISQIEVGTSYNMPRTVKTKTIVKAVFAPLLSKYSGKRNRPLLGGSTIRSIAGKPEMNRLEEYR